ncbi:MAG: TolC family protein [Rubrivivax sp.]|jgi:NodT family efflux transporter outer membrane factor (OMF) lipoprotein
MNIQPMKPLHLSMVHTATSPAAVGGSRSPARQHRPLLCATALATAVLLGGCAGLLPAGPSAPAEPASPTAWMADGGSTPSEGLNATWARQADPELQALLQQAEAANRDIAQAALRLAQAGTQAGLGALRLTPSASLGAGASRPLDPPDPLPARTTRSTSASLGVGYELDLWGRLAALRAADAAQVRAAQTDVQAARLLLRQRVADAYWQLAAARQQGELAQQQLVLNRELLAATRLRVQEGKLLPIEVDRAAATLQQAEVRLADLQADVAQQRLQLALLLDQPAPGPQVQRPQLPPLQADGLPPGWRVEGTPAEVLARRPDVQRARAQVDAALARARATQAQRYPTLSFSASLSSGGGAGEWLNNPLAALAGNLVVPLIDWRRLDLQGAAAQTELDLAALALRDTVARALVEVETARLDDTRLRQQLQANTTRLQEAQAAEKLAALRLSVGAIARADFLQAQNARLEAEQGRLQLQLRLWLNRGQLARALALG